MKNTDFPDPAALWVWPGMRYDTVNTYAGFRHDFDMAGLPTAATFFITADQNYRLYVNGKYVCRGPVRGHQHSWHFDKLDLLPYLKPGHNWISVECHNTGNSTYVYRFAGAAGFLCSANWDNGTKILSRREGWTIFRNPAYERNTGLLSFQMGWQESIDLELDDRSWIFAEKDFRLPPAMEEIQPSVEPMGALPWTGLTKTLTPTLDSRCQAPEKVLFSDMGKCATAPILPGRSHNLASEFVRNEYPSIQPGPALEGVKEGDFLTCIVPASGAGNWRAVTFDMGQYTWLTGAPILKVENGDKGMIADLFFTRILRNGRFGFADAPWEKCRVSLACRVRFAEESGSHEFYQNYGTRYVTVLLRENTKDVKLSLSWRRSVMPLEIKGSFRCSDPVLNDIHRISVHTQRVCAMDTYVDTPWREQSQWWSDARIQAKNVFYLTGSSAMLEQGIRIVAGQHAPSDLTFGCVPTKDCGPVLPDFSLAWVMTVYDHWFQTGSNRLFLEMKERIEAIFLYFEGTKGEDGLLKYDNRFWLFEDWCDLPKTHTPTYLNLWYLYTKIHYQKLLEISEMREEARELLREIRAMKALLVKSFYDPAQELMVPELDAEGKQAGIPSVHDQVLAILTDLLPEAVDSFAEKRLLPCLKGTLTEGAQPSSFWASYLMDAAQMLGYEKEALEYLKTGWEKMIPDGTTWEIFPHNTNSQASVSHAWSAHPVTHLPELFFGLKQLEPAWTRTAISPNFLRDEAEFVLPVPQGELKGLWKKEADGYHFALSVPDGMILELKLAGTVRTTDGKAVQFDEVIPG